MVRALEDEVDQVAGTRRWIEGDDSSIDSLRAEGWDFGGTEAAGTLPYLAKFGDDALIPALLEQGINLTRVGEALAPAAGRAGVATITALLAAGAGSHSDDLNQALLEAAIQGRVAIMNLLLRRGADPAYIDRPGRTLLIGAAESGNPAAVRIALGYGIDPNLRTVAGDTALLAAFGHFQFVDVLPEGVDLAAVARLLLDVGADPNVRGRIGETALDDCNSYPEAALVLIQHGAQVNVEDDMGLTPLMRAFTVDVAKVLIAGGADPNYRIKSGETVFTKKNWGIPDDVLAYLKGLGGKHR